MATRGTPDTAIDASVPSRADAASGEALSLPPTPAATPSLRPASPARTDSSAWPHQPPYGQAQAANGAHGYADGRGRGDGHGQGASASFATAAPGPPVSAEVRSQAMAWNPSLSHPVVDALVGEAVTALQRPRSPEHVDRKRKADHFDAMGGLYGVGNGGPGMAYPRKRVCRLLNIVKPPSFQQTVDTAPAPPSNARRPMSRPAPQAAAPMPPMPMPPPMMMDPSYAQHPAYAYAMPPYMQPSAGYAPMPPGLTNLDVINAAHAAMMPPPAVPVRGHP